ncbi:hypothetical protein FK220_010515 [Flavobacteriaceae bacterium TP-CH-4]|uniref:Sensory transduction regulator n=1 Tax=Pelagihabitans pacificus TaxID=2696054 RepID=A0A967ASX0_9FLAO|nr:hypothetical protein [Pelagihabitans pacificus]NHF59774.1 hypothetical protein [Pelagihabitans pacificus]
MYRLLPFVLLFFFLCTQNMIAQDMNPAKLRALIAQVADTTEAQGNSIRFIYKGTFLVCVYDENANRMRIITPIVEREQLGEEELLNALVANFHSALDVKYALSDEIIWSVFIHPLKELSKHQVLDAIDQVYSASATFGTTFSSTDLVFPGNTRKRDSITPKKLIKKQKI